MEGGECSWDAVYNRRVNKWFKKEMNKFPSCLQEKDHSHYRKEERYVRAD